MNPTAARERMSQFIYKARTESNPLGQLQEALIMSIELEPLQKRVRVEGVKTGRVTALDLHGQISQALALGIISHEEASTLRAYDAKVLDIINVDDFAPHELGAGAGADP
jgi:acyl-CoA dehydrogenase